MDRVRIGDICEILNGFAFKSENYVESGIRIIRIANVQKGYIEDSTPAFYPKDENGIEKYLLESGDLLMSLTGNVGRVAILTDDFLPAALNQRVACLRMKTDKVSKGYLYHILNSNYFENQCIQAAKGVAQKNMSTEWLKEYEIPLFPISKQAEIVSILDNVSSVIAKRQQQLSALDDLIKARFVEMFGNADRYPMEPLDDNVHEMFIGPFGSALKNECFVEPEDGYCIVYEQKHAIQKTMDVPTRYVDEKKYKELKRFSVFPGDIIVSCRGTIGEIFIVPEGAPLGIMHPSIMKIRLDTKKYDQKFFVLALEQYMDEHNNEAKGSGVKMAVTATALGKNLFVVPPMDVQKQFSAFVAQIDKSKSAIQKSLDETQVLFDSLMQEYFG